MENVFCDTKEMGSPTPDPVKMNPTYAKNGKIIKCFLRGSNFHIVSGCPQKSRVPNFASMTNEENLRRHRSASSLIFGD